MAKWWKPTAESHFRHVPKAHTLAVVKEAISPEAAENLAKLKKDALAAEVEQRLANTGWLPEVLRLPMVATAEPELIAAE
jgi:ParB family chromosome partitioning protein